jgi:hypothetical protein
MQARCRGALFLLLLPLLSISAGCRNKTDLVEMELRTRETMLRESQEEQRRVEGQNLALQREIEALRQGAKVTPEQAAQTFGLKRIMLSRTTGGLDHDGLPGDEILQVVMEPRDVDDHTIKSPGTLQVGVLEISPQGVKTPLCSWDIPPEKLRESWKQGLLSTGYTLTLPWKELPTTEQLRVIVRLITPDHRVYEADKDIKVKLVPGASFRRTAPPLEMLPPPTPVPSEIGPILVPTNRITTSSFTPRTTEPARWQTVTPSPTTLGLPEAISP